MSELRYTVAVLDPADDTGTQFVARTVTLDIARINRFEPRAVYDPSETDLLYTHFLIDVDFVFNPFSTSSNLFNNLPNDNPRINPGFDPFTSEADLRQFLMTPRGRLLLSVGGLTLDSSPRNFAVRPAGGRNIPTVDARNGPRPISCPCESVHGVKTIKGRYVIETWVAEADPSYGAMLSNRWSVEQNVDTDNFMLTSKHVEGLAIFRSDVLAVEGVKPDDFRNRLGHPIRNGVMRKNIQVKAEPDGLQIRYSFDDEEQVTNLNPAYGIVKAEIFQEIDAAWNLGFSGVASIDAVFGMLPEGGQNYTVRLWGKRSTTRRQLGLAASNVLARLAPKSVLNGIPAVRGGIAPNHSWSVRMDQMGRFIDVTAGFRVSGYVGGVAALIAAPSLQTTLVSPDPPWPEDIGDVGSTNILPNIAPPASTGMRGGFLEAMVAQVLTFAGQYPPLPPPSSVSLEIHEPGDP